MGRQFTRVALGVAAFALASSVLATPGPTAAPSTPAAPPKHTQVVVVALDGVRFREIFEGVDAELARKQNLPAEQIKSAAELMPHLHELMTTSGAAVGAPGHGASISASGPDFVSLPGYSEIFTGRRVTGCWNNLCGGTDSRSFADELAEHSPDADQAVAVITSWPDIAKVASRSDRVAVSAGKHAGSTRSRFEEDPSVAALLHLAEGETSWPGHDGFRRDRFTAALALGYLEAAEPRFLFVGLGETDEFAHQNNYAGYLDALRRADDHIHALAMALAARAARGVQTALFVTADHGRAAGFRDHGKPYPESARVWLVASGSAIPARGFVSAPTPRHLADIAPTLRSVFGLRADRAQTAGVALSELLTFDSRR